MDNEDEDDGPFEDGPPNERAWLWALGWCIALFALYVALIWYGQKLIGPIAH